MGRIGCKAWIFKKELYKKTREDLMEEVKLIPKEELEKLPEVAAVVPELPIASKQLEIEDDMTPEEGA